MNDKMREALKEVLDVPGIVDAMPDYVWIMANDALEAPSDTGPWSVERDEHGHAAWIKEDDRVVLWLIPGTERGEQNVDRVVEALNRLAIPPTEQTGRVKELFDDIIEASRMTQVDINGKICLEWDTWILHLHEAFGDLSEYAAPAVSLPSVEELAKMLHDTQMAPFSMPGSLLFESLTEGGLQEWIDRAEALHALLADRLGKPVEVDFSRWAKTQGFDAWAADHAAVLRNLKAYLKAEGVRVKE